MLLERAAYRLVTTTDEVLPVAVDAGYASHEAFTRAFTRAYGQPPSRWRRRPTGFRLEAPSNVHFHPPGALRVPADRKVNDMEFLTRMVEHHIWLVSEMLTGPNGYRTTSSMHLSRSPSRASTAIPPFARCSPGSSVSSRCGMPRPTTSLTTSRERGQSIGELRQALAQAGPAFLTQVRSIIEEGRLDETFVDAVCDPPEVFTYGGMIAHVLTFAAHRRTLVCGALADAGVTDLGSGDPMRWVALDA